MDVLAVLEALEARLAALNRGGVAWLSVNADPEMRELLSQFRAQSLAQHETFQRTRPEISAEITAKISAEPEGRHSGRDSEPSVPSTRVQASGASSAIIPPPSAPVKRGAKTPESMGGDASAPRTQSKAARTASVLPPPEQCLTLESLQVRYRACDRCALAATRNRLVFGAGHESPRLMILGEAPGADEDLQGLPFVGRAGRLLTGLISALGLTREDVYITNVVKCRPPDNRNPEPEEAAQCRPILQRQIELLNPRLILTLGNVPLKALNPQARGITGARGHTFKYLDWTVLPTYHPSYLLRNPAAIPECWRDFKQAFASAFERG